MLFRSKEPASSRNAEAFSGVQGVSLVRKREVSLDECTADAVKQFAKAKRRVQELGDQRT